LLREIVLSLGLRRFLFLSLPRVSRSFGHLLRHVLAHAEGQRRLEVRLDDLQIRLRGDRRRMAKPLSRYVRGKGPYKGQRDDRSAPALRSTRDDGFVPVTHTRR
jgi:hypothetical protein